MFFGHLSTEPLSTTMSNDNSASIVSKVWNYAHVLKNAGVGYGDYVEQITYLLFLKLAEEMTELGFDNPIPAKFQWSELSSQSGDDLEVRTTAIDHLESELDRQITRSNRLRQSALSAAFSGSL